MALKTDEIKKMSEKDRKKKLEELKFELIKSQVEGSGAQTSKTREIRKMIAQILTLNK